jgi:membrane-associated protein
MGIDLEGIISAVGYPGLIIIIFAETGLLIGFFLPGDSLLITTGVLIQRGQFQIAGENGLWFMIPLLIIAAIAGDAVGYQIGKRAGPRLFAREDSRWLNRKHLERARAFYEKHGGKTIFFARFLAFIRTFAPTVAGAADMPYRKFAVYNVAGGVTWIVSMLLLGYGLGEAVPNVDAIIFGLLVVVVAITTAPALWHFWRERQKGRRAAIAEGER